MSEACTELDARLEAPADQDEKEWAL